MDNSFWIKLTLLPYFISFKLVYILGKLFSDFLGISVPSCRGGIPLSKITGCIVKCLRRNEGTDMAPDNGGAGTLSTAATRFEGLGTKSCSMSCEIVPPT